MEKIAGIASRLSPEVSRRLSYDYRTKATLFGWPLIHVATGVDPATGRKRTAKGIIAVGSHPRGVIAFGDTAVGVIACGIFGYGLISISVVAVGIIAWGSVAAGVLVAMGGLAVAPIAIGGAAFGWYANGAMAWGKHILSPYVSDPLAIQFFSPYVSKFITWTFRATIVVAPLFLALGHIPKLMAKISERRRQKRFQTNQSKSN